MNYLEILYKPGAFEPAELKMIFDKYPGQESSLIKIMGMSAGEIESKAKILSSMLGADWQRICTKLAETNERALFQAQTPCFIEQNDVGNFTEKQDLQKKLFPPYSHVGTFGVSRNIAPIHKLKLLTKLPVIRSFRKYKY